MPDDELDLPEEEFTYLAGPTDRPWNHFIGRWQAIRTVLQEMLRCCDASSPLRLVDVGSCTGFFSLQAAYRHPEVDVIAVEGSVGIGNGTVGMAGSPDQILRTRAVQTHLRWIKRLGLKHCFIAPEVWDYARVCDLGGQGRPICDVMLLLSIIHHIDSVSLQQYNNAGLSRLAGFIDLLGKLLQLAPRHFVELPNRPWLVEAYDTYGTPRGILEAGASASGREWSFTGPIFATDWFGMREIWVMEVKGDMAMVDVERNPFPFLVDGEHQDADGRPHKPGNYRSFDTDGGATAGTAGDDDGADSYGILDSHYGHELSNMNYDDAPLEMDVGVAGPHRQLHGHFPDPRLMVAGPCEPVDEKIGQALGVASTPLLMAHLALREAIDEAHEVLREVRDGGAMLNNMEALRIATSNSAGRYGGAAAGGPPFAAASMRGVGGDYAPPGPSQPAPGASQPAPGLLSSRLPGLVAPLREFA